MLATKHIIEIIQVLVCAHAFVGGLVSRWECKAKAVGPSQTQWHSQIGGSDQVELTTHHSLPSLRWQKLRERLDNQREWYGATEHSVQRAKWQLRCKFKMPTTEFILEHWAHTPCATSSSRRYRLRKKWGEKKNLHFSSIVVIIVAVIVLAFIVCCWFQCLFFFCFMGCCSRSGGKLPAGAFSTIKLF